MKESDVIKIDVDGVIRARLPRHCKFIPGFMVRWLERFICQDQLNQLLLDNAGKRDADFCAGVLRDLGVTYSIEHADRLPSSSDRRVTFVSNHPLGALDGIIMIDWVTRIYGPGVKFVVNDLLMAVEPLRGTFVPINKHGRQNRAEACGVDRAFSSDNPVIVFPAGMCSRKAQDGEIRDLEWQKMFVNKCIDNHRDVIPVFFNGENSKFFYNFAKFRAKLGLRFNIEMIRLPREVFLSRGRHFSISVGFPVPWTELQGGPGAGNQAQDIKRMVYNS